MKLLLMLQLKHPSNMPIKTKIPVVFPPQTDFEPECSIEAHWSVGRVLD